MFKSHHQHPVFQEVRQAMQILGDRWSALILLAVLEGPCRFGEIEQKLEGITPRALTQKLQSLEESGLIERQEFKEFPPRTEYVATDKARDLKEALHGLKAWAKKYCCQKD